MSTVNSLWGTKKHSKPKFSRLMSGDESEWLAQRCHLQAQVSSLYCTARQHPCVANSARNDETIDHITGLPHYVDNQKHGRLCSGETQSVLQIQEINLCSTSSTAWIITFPPSSIIPSKKLCATCFMTHEFQLIGSRNCSNTKSEHRSVKLNQESFSVGTMYTHLDGAKPSHRSRRTLLATFQLTKRR